MATYASLLNYEDMTAVMSNLSNGDGDMATTLAIPNGIGMLSVQKRTSGESPGNYTTVHLGINVSSSDGGSTPYGISFWGVPDTNIMVPTISAGPPVTLTLTFDDTDVLEIKFTAPSGNITVSIPSMSNTIHDLSVSFSGLTLSPPP
jgi:hypothetical protein